MLLAGPVPTLSTISPALKSTRTHALVLTTFLMSLLEFETGFGSSMSANCGVTLGWKDSGKQYLYHRQNAIASHLGAQRNGLIAPILGNAYIRTLRNVREHTAPL